MNGDSNLFEQHRLLVHCRMLLQWTVCGGVLSFFLLALCESILIKGLQISNFGAFLKREFFQSLLLFALLSFGVVVHENRGRMCTREIPLSLT